MKVYKDLEKFDKNKIDKTCLFNTRKKDDRVVKNYLLNKEKNMDLTKEKLGV